MTGRNTESMVLLVRAKNLARAELASVGKDLDQVGLRAHGAQGKAVAFGKFAGAAMLGIGAAAAGMAVIGIKAFGDFEDRLNQSMAIMGDVAPELRQEMSDTARAIAKETRIGAGEAADAFFFLASAGLNAEQSIAALPQVAAFAQAGMFDMARATDLATDAQSALGLTVKDPTKNLENLTHVTDVLTKANILANASVEQFSTALTNKAGAALKVVNKDIEEGVAVLAAFADQGIKAEEAGTALNIIMRDLQTQSIKNRDTWDELGVQVFDATGKMNNMGDIIGQLETLLMGMSDEQKKATLAQMGFNDKSVIFIQTLLGTSEKIKGYEESLRSAGGITQEVADKQLESMNAQFELLGHRAKDVMIGLGEDLAPTIKDELLPALNLLVDSTGDFMEAVGPVLVKTIKFAADAMVSMQIIVLDFIGIWDDEARRKSQQILLNKELAEGLGETMDPAKRLAAAMITLGKQNAWTEDGLKSLIVTTGANTSQVLEARDAVLEHAEAAGYDQKYIDMLRAATEDATAAAMDFSPEKVRMMNATADATDATQEEIDALEEVTGATEEALTAQQEYTDAIKALTDPVFGAVSAIGDMQEATEKVTELTNEGKEGTDEWILAQLDLAEATISAQDALDEMNPDTLTNALDDIALAMGKSRDEVIDYLEQLGVLDGKEVRIILGVDAPTIEYYQEGQSLKPKRGRMLAFAEGGSFYRGQPMLVGEDGWEWLVPGSFGTVVSNPDTPGGNFEDWMEAMVRSSVVAPSQGRPGPDTPFQHIGQIVFQGTPQQMLDEYRHETKLAMRGL